MLGRVPRAPRHKLFHLEAPRKKHEENSHRGDREAVRRGFSWTDHDEQLDADGNSWNTHWHCPLRWDDFIDPLLPRLDVRTPITRMHSDQVVRLITRKGGYRIRPSHVRAIHAIDLGLGVEFEAKTDRYTEEYFRWFGRQLGKRRLQHLWVKAFPQYARSLEAASVLDVPRVVLSHGGRVDRSLKPFITHRRGKLRWK